MSLLEIWREDGYGDELDRALKRLNLTEQQALYAPFEAWQKLKREFKRQQQRTLNRRKFRREQARRAARIRWHGRPYQYLNAREGH